MGSYGPEPPTGVTAQLSHWISNLQLSDIPPPVLERAKYQLLDGIACALVGAHVPWSEKYVEATAEYEPVGEYSVIGWDKVCEINNDFSFFFKLKLGFPPLDHENGTYYPSRGAPPSPIYVLTI